MLLLLINALQEDAATLLQHNDSLYNHSSILNNQVNAKRDTALLFQAAQEETIVLLITALSHPLLQLPINKRDK